MAIKKSLWLIVLFLVISNFPFLGNALTSEQNSEAILLDDNYNLNISNDSDNQHFTDIEIPYGDYYANNIPRTGTQKFAVVCVKFADIPNTRWTTDGIGGLMSWTNIFWQNVSYGLIDLQWEIVGWYTLSKNKADYGNLSDSFYQISLEAIELAINDINFKEFNHILVVINTWYCGISTVGNSKVFPFIDVSKAFSLTMVAENNPDSVARVWGRWTHEQGHAFGLGHTHGDKKHEQDYASYYSLMARGYPSDLNIYHQLFDKKSGWFDPTTNEIIVNPGDASNFTVYPRSLGISGITQALKVVITNDYYYRVEVVRKYAEDAWVPLEGVYIYLVDHGRPKNDQCIDMDSTEGSCDPDYYDCLWQVGDKFEDEKNNIVIEIKEKIGENYKIFVQNMASGHVDLAISKWGDPPGTVGPYESKDIWIDSPINGWGKLRYHDEYNNPIGNGDEPLANHVNHLYAMIHNIGDADAVDFDVYFYENYPIGGGDDSVWSLIDMVNVPLLPKGEQLAVHVNWTPEIDVGSSSDFIFKYHGCVKVVIIKDEFEVSLGNNQAQENIAFFEVTSKKSAPMEPIIQMPSSFFEPVTTRVKVKNPFPEAKLLYIGMTDLDGNWNVTGPGLYQWHAFTANQIKYFDITITPMDDVRFTDSAQPSLYIGVIEHQGEDEFGFIPGCHMNELPGLTLKVIAMYRSKLELNGAVRTNNIQLFGNVIYIDDVQTNHLPASAERNLFVVITNKDVLQTQYFIVPFNADGSFEYEYVVATPGNYSVTFYFGGTGVIAKSYSVTLLIDTISGKVSTSGKNAFIPAFEFIITICTICVTTTLIRIKMRKKQ